MEYAANRKRAWLGMAGTLGLVFGAAGVAPAGDHPADCKDCQAYYQTQTHHGGPGMPRAMPPHYPMTPGGAPVVYETQERGLVSKLLGRKRYSIPLYHQVQGEKPVPLYPTPDGAKLVAAPAPASDPYAGSPSLAAEPAYGPDALPAVAWGEPAPIGVMRTDYQAMAAEAAARAQPTGPSGAMGPMAGGPGAMPGQPKPHDPRIDLWHTKVASGSSMVAGGEKKTLLMHLTDGESPLDRWREARRTRKTLRSHGTLAPVPMGGMGMGPNR